MSPRRGGSTPAASHPGPKRRGAKFKSRTCQGVAVGVALGAAGSGAAGGMP